jgi:hypothetical protein
MVSAGFLRAAASLEEEGRVSAGSGVAGDVDGVARQLDVHRAAVKLRSGDTRSICRKPRGVVEHRGTQ